MGQGTYYCLNHPGNPHDAGVTEVEQANIIQAPVVPVQTPAPIGTNTTGGVGDTDALACIRAAGLIK